MNLPTLYSRTSTGAVTQWTIEVCNEKYRTIHGQTNGKLQTTEWTICSGKNEGRANATTAHEQALKEAQALWRKRKESGCFEDIAMVDTELYIEPMLAKKYEDRKDELTFPLYSSSKLDGCRCIASKKGLFSRNGKPFKSVPHIYEALKPIFERYPDVIIDGELYCDKFSNDFNAICSLVKKTKPTPSDLAESANAIQYWIYDVVDTSKKFTERYPLLEEINKMTNDSIKLVVSTKVNSFKELDHLYENYIQDGYEGQMIRTDSKYELKRSKNLLKRKEFQDTEYVIERVIEGEGNRTGVAGAILFEGGQRASIKGNREYCKELLDSKDQLIGKLATIKYFNKTPDGQLRFPVMIGVRDYE